MGKTGNILLVITFDIYSLIIIFYVSQFNSVMRLPLTKKENPKVLFFNKEESDIVLYFLLPNIFILREKAQIDYI